MLSNIDPSGQRFLDSLSRLQSRLEEAQRRISSGRSMNQPADAPDQISPVLQLHADIRMNRAIATNLRQVKTDVDAGEQTVSSSVDLLQQASVLATQATGPLQTAGTRATLSSAVEALLEKMVANANTTVGGRFIFSGDADGSPSYQLNLASPTGVDALQYPAATARIAAPGGSTFQPARPAGEIFDPRDALGGPAPGNAFAALNSLRLALAGNDEAAIRGSISELSEASRYLNNQLAFYGQTQDRVTSAIAAAENGDTQLKAELGSRQDADLAGEITAMQQAATHIQAALQSRAQMPHSSLFDMLSRG